MPDYSRPLSGTAHTVERPDGTAIHTVSTGAGDRTVRPTRPPEVHGRLGRNRFRLDEVIARPSQLPFGGTDCALPMRWATKHRVELDAIEIYTDNETWAGDIHPHQALEQYPQTLGRPCKLAVVGMTATRFSIADPQDPDMMDVVGFDG